MDKILQNELVIFVLACVLFLMARAYVKLRKEVDVLQRQVHDMQHRQDCIEFMHPNFQVTYQHFVRLRQQGADLNTKFIVVEEDSQKKNV